MSYDVSQGIERWLDVLLTAQSNGIDPVEDATYQDVSVRYTKEGGLVSTLKSVAAADWRNLTDGVYRLKFTAVELDTLGSLTYSVRLAGGYSCTEFVPYYGHVDVVSGDVTYISNLLSTVNGNVNSLTSSVFGIGSDVDGLATGISLITSEMIGLNSYQVGLGAYYDAENTTLNASLVLHKNGAIVANPVSARLVVYDELGTLLINVTSVSPDAQGVFRFEESVTLVEATVPYASGVVVDLTGTHSTLTLTPVVG